MNLDPEICYRALRTRDARFDGRFFTGVRSTGVFCRPVCPARTPRQENCSFFACAAAAREAGFRPCLRCRPEASPGTPAWLGTSATVTRALRLISQGGLDHGRVEDLAARLGVGDRHLRRLFLEHLGATPSAVAQTRRVLFAKKLLDETELPMSRIAVASGFSSIRRFNAVMRETYGRSPRELRRDRAPCENAGRSEITLRLPFRPPFDWASIAAFLAMRATPDVEAVGPDFYRRTVRIDGVRGWIEVRPVEGESWLAARIALSGPAVLIGVAERARRIFDLGADPEAITSHLRHDRRLAGALRDVPGVRVPGAWDGFELSVRAILGQQVSVRGATTLAGRIARRYGEPLDVEGSSLGSRLGADAPRLLFPTPERLAAADLTSSGLPRARARAISTLASVVASGELRLDGTGDAEETVGRLKELPGIGEWTAQYVAMRALGEPDAFPASDLGLRRALGNGKGPAPEGGVRDRAEAWRPWRAYAAMALWMAGPKGHEKGGSHGASRR